MLLQDLVIPNLPAPFYHFEYDGAGRVRTASFASGLNTYDVSYDGNRISEMRNTIIVNHDRLRYSYDDLGRVSGVTYADATGRIYTTLFFWYDGARLTKLERAHRVDAGFIIDKTMSFTYYADGNVQEITEHRPELDGQPATTTVDRFEQYDDRINVDGFSLLHDDFFDHLVLLPDVQLQPGNPAREIRTGDGLNYTVIYQYVYDASNRPVSKTGNGTFDNGADAGRRFQTQSLFTYY